MIFNNRLSYGTKVLLVIIQFFILSEVLLLLYHNFSGENALSGHVSEYDEDDASNLEDYNVWLIFTRAGKNSPLRYKFSNLIENLLNVSSVPLKFHVIVDESSQEIALNELKRIRKSSKHNVEYNFYNKSGVVAKIDDIVSIMRRHFSSGPRSYYNDALFYISLGLHRIAPESHRLAVMLDCDLYFKDDFLVLFKEFQWFKSTALFGLAPELTPVYLHILNKYRRRHKMTTTFGDYYHETDLIPSIKVQHPRGFQGYNSGVLLLNLTKIRESETYKRLLSNSSVDFLTKKYSFRGHLGDQDFYTLVGYEYPDLIQTLNCGLNRQLCTWWKNHGYKDVFDDYAKCDHKVAVLHGNCKTKIPI